MRSYRQDKPLDNATLAYYAPAVAATAPAGNVSNRYGFLNTLGMVDAIRDTGWLPVAVDTPSARTEQGREFGKHVIRFRRHADLHGVQGIAPAVGDIVPELLLWNAHDATSSFRFMAGLYRYICSNGLVVADESFGDVRVRHTKYSIQKGKDAALAVLDLVPAIMGTVDLWKQIDMTQELQEEYAVEAIQLREGAVIPSVAGVLASRRYEDNGTDLFTVYNRVQENLVKGRIQGWNPTDGHRATLRPVGDVAKALDLNRNLWSLTEEYALAA